jgi:TatD DNase family protein
MWIDTHCHLDADEFDVDRDEVVARARAAGVTMIVMPTGHVDDRAKACSIAHQYGFAYALGLHPLVARRRRRASTSTACGRGANRSTMRVLLRSAKSASISSNRATLRARNGSFASSCASREFALPVIVHVRRSADLLLKHLRRIEVPGGIIHAFNGSAQQADQFITRGFKLGFGGSLTYSGSQRIRRHAAGLTERALVLETDAPYIAPEWRRTPDGVERTEPADLARIAVQLAALRGVDSHDLARASARNAIEALPRLAPLLAPAA